MGARISIEREGAITVAGVGPVRDVAVSPDGRYAYAAADRLDGPRSVMWAVEVVDTDTNAVIATIADLAAGAPTSLLVSPDSSRLYVTDRATACIHVVDVNPHSDTRHRVLHALSVDGSSPVGYGAPTALAVSPDGALLYALASNAVLVIDPDSRAVGEVVSGADALAMYATGDRIYVCSEDRRGHNT